MSHENIVRAWQDENFRNSLTEKERSLLPENPAGLVELTDTQLSNVTGSRASTEPFTLTGCPDILFTLLC